MPDGTHSGREPENWEEKRFIREKVVRPPFTKKQIALRAAGYVGAAVVFGVVASVSFAAVKPVADRYLGEQEPEGETVSIPKDVPAEPQAPAEAETPTEESEPIEEQVQSALENYRYTVEDLNAMLTSLRGKIQEASKGIVAVHSVQQDVDWFNNEVETTGLYAGAVIADTSQELLILTPEAAVENADSIKVTIDSRDVDGRMKQKDTVTGIAIVSVSTADLDETMRSAVQVVPLGNSYTAREGDLIAAVGSPAGMVHSVDYGFIAYAAKSGQMVDGVSRVLYADILSDATRGTFMLNTSGELIGWAMTPESDQSQAAEIMGISDYKGTLEKLTNGVGAPLFGVVGQEISDSMAQSGLPRGIYVASVVPDGPAYNGGIQNGDIITAMGGNEITTMRDFQTTIESLECGQLISVLVERNGRDQYTQLEFQVTVGAR